MSACAGRSIGDPALDCPLGSGRTYQTNLFRRAEPAIDTTFRSLRRVHLDADAWLDIVPGWLANDAALFEELERTCDWTQRKRWLYEQERIEPRLTSSWSVASGAPLEPAILETMRCLLSERYDVSFDSVGFNLYRDGQDSVAWHRDKIRQEVETPIVPLVSLGEARKLLFRPLGGGQSRAFSAGRGDLLVTGGTAQWTWEHAILKVARAGPRISIAFRYGMRPRAYRA